MKSKKVIILIFIFFILLILVFIKLTSLKKQSAQETAKEKFFELSNNISEAFISRIIIYKGNGLDKKIVFSKNADRDWLIETTYDLKARIEAIKQLLEELSELKGELRAESKAVLSDFSISDELGIHVILEANKDDPLKHFVISPKKPNWVSNFVRLAGSEKIVLVNKDILYKLNIYDEDANLDYKSFADLKITSFDSDKINKIEIIDADKAFSLTKVIEKDKTIWKTEPLLQAENTIDESKITEFIKNINNLFAQEIFDPVVTTYGFDKPTLQIKLTFKDGKELLQINVGSLNESQKTYYFKASSQNPVFSVTDKTVENLKKDQIYFIKPAENKQTDNKLQVPPATSSSK